MCLSTSPAVGDRRAAVAAERDVQISSHGGFGRPPKPLTPEAEKLFALVKAAGADLGQSIAWQPTGGVCDGNNIAACGVPVVDTMGVRGGKIHSDEEYLIVDSLAERAALSIRMATRTWALLSISESNSPSSSRPSSRRTDSSALARTWRM